MNLVFHTDGYARVLYGQPSSLFWSGQLWSVPTFSETEMFQPLKQIQTVVDLCSPALSIYIYTCPIFIIPQHQPVHTVIHILC